ISPDWKTMAIASNKQKSELYDVSSAKLVRTLDIMLGGAKVSGSTFSSKFSPKSPPAMVFSVDGKTLALYENRPPRVALFDTATGKQTGTLLPESPNIPKVESFPIGNTAPTGSAGLAFSPDSRCLAWD